MGLLNVVAIALPVIQITLSISQAGIIGSQAIWNAYGKKWCVLYPSGQTGEWLLENNKTCDGIIGIAMVAGVAIPLLALILQIMVQKKNFDLSKTATLLWSIFYLLATITVFVGACMNAVGVKMFCDRADNVNQSSTCDRQFDWYSNHFDPSADRKLNHLIAAYICGFIAFAAGLLYAIIKLAQYKKLKNSGASEMSRI